MCNDALRSKYRVLRVRGGVHIKQIPKVVYPTAPVNSDFQPDVDTAVIRPITDRRVVDQQVVRLAMFCLAKQMPHWRHRIRTAACTARDCRGNSRLALTVETQRLASGFRLTTWDGN